MKRLGTRLLGNGLRVLSFGLVVMYGVGCATQATMVDLELTQQKIQLEQSQIQERLRILERSIDDGVSTNPLDQTDFIIRLDQVATELQALRGKLEETTFQSADMAQRLDDMTFRTKEFTDRMDILDRQVALLEVSIAKLTKAGSPDEFGMVEAETPDTPQEAEKAIVLPGRPMEGSQSSGLSPSEAYGLAYNDYIKGNYDLALMGFRNFLSQYQNTSLAPNAQYWIGESYYGKKDYRKAIEAFQQVVSNYPESNKVAGALLKAGYSYIELADRERGTVHLKKVIEEFPFSNEANLAKNRLAELK